MKRLALGLFGVSIITGLGWLGVVWSQHRNGSQDGPLPDLTKQAVNAEAASWANNPTRESHNEGRDAANSASPAIADRAPSDPFQGISQTAATLNTPTISGG